MKPRECCDLRFMVGPLSVTSHQQQCRPRCTHIHAHTCKYTHIQYLLIGHTKPSRAPRHTRMHTNTLHIVVYHGLSVCQQPSTFSQLFTKAKEVTHPAERNDSHLGPPSSSPAGGMGVVRPGACWGQSP